MKQINKTKMKLKKGSTFKRRKSKKLREPIEKPQEYSSEESDNGEDMLRMVENEDLEFMKSAIKNKSYSFLNNIRLTGSEPTAKKRRLTTEEDDLEEQYENTLDESNVKVKPLLPIKTKTGIVPQTRLVPIENDVSENEEDNNSIADESDIESVIEESSEPLTTAQLIATRSETLRNKKVEIGSLSAAILEAPEDKIGNLGLLLKIMDEKTPEVFLTVRKLATVSVLEIFKDIIPEYEIKPLATEGVKLKKDTLRLHKYETSLLQYYKSYLKKLEKFTTNLTRKKGSGIITEEKRKLGLVALQCMCDLLVTHPYFNYSQNLAQAVIPFLNHSNKTIRDIVKPVCIKVFKEDKKEEITLKILRIINQIMKKHAHNVQTEMLEVLLFLRIKDVNLDKEKEHEIKEKKLKSKKHNILQLSKKEKKRKKRLQQLEKELLETKAEENKELKKRNLTEITKIVFGIYFRILKSSENNKILSICLEGLAKYAHCINIEFYVDIVNVLDKLLKQEDWLGTKERLHCIQTVFSILSGQGEALNLDPVRFYVGLYQELLNIHAGRTHDHFPILLQIIDNAILKRRKKITNKRLIGFVKRLAVLALQLPHAAALGCLGFVKTALQFNKSVDILLDLDSAVGDGVFQPDLEDPEYCNAGSSALFEVSLLSRHYHPVVRMYARHVVNGVPTNGEHSLPAELNKCGAEQLFAEFDMSQMAFNPPVPVPKKVQAKSGRVLGFADAEFKEHCKRVMKRCNGDDCGFYIDAKRLKI